MVRRMDACMNAWMEHVDQPDMLVFVCSESQYTFQLSPNCTRSLKSLLGQVLLLNDSPKKSQSSVTFYILLERYSPRLQISLMALNSSVVAPKLLPFSRDTKDLPRPVQKQFRNLASGAEPFFFSYSTVTYALPGVYSAQLLIRSQNGLDSLSFESNLSVTGTDIVLALLLSSARLFNRGPYNVGEESVLAVVLDNTHTHIELTLDFGDGSAIVQRGGLSFLLGAFPEKPGYACVLSHR